MRLRVTTETTSREFWRALERFPSRGQLYTRIAMCPYGGTVTVTLEELQFLYSLPKFHTEITHEIS